MDKVLNLLQGNFWIVNLERCKLSQFEIDFLKIFFDIKLDIIVDDNDFKERKFLILKKKSKFLIH
jgi:hypothetical protein